MTSFEPFILTGHKILDFSRRLNSTFESWTTENCFKPGIKLVWFWSGLIWFAFSKIFWRLGENNFYLIFTPSVFLPPGHEVKKLPGEKRSCFPISFFIEKKWENCLFSCHFVFLVRDQVCSRLSTIRNTNFSLTYFWTTQRFCKME